jgi:anti-sigma factor RsiW
MDCHESTALLQAYGDGELDPVRSAEIERHLIGCAECAGRRDELSALRARIRAEVPYHRAPATVRARALAALDAAVSTPAPSRRPRDRWSWLTAGALAGSAATVLAWFIGSAVLDWEADHDLVTEAVTNHTRATLGNRLIDVASSDQHTVKPWLSARLDYSPPVRDFSADGLPLIGGRLDYLDRRAVVALVYRHNQHPINLFVFPAGAGSAPGETVARQGYNLVHWDQGGLSFWAVSDLNAGELQDFRQLIVRAGQPTG